MDQYTVVRSRKALERDFLCNGYGSVNECRALHIKGLCHQRSRIGSSAQKQKVAYFGIRRGRSGIGGGIISAVLAAGQAAVLVKFGHRITRLKTARVQPSNYLEFWRFLQ